jgi:hypothetical protein
MSPKVSTGKNEWDKAIEESREMLARVEAKAKRLRTSIITLEEARDAGEKWPIQTATQN